MNGSSLGLLDRHPPTAVLEAEAPRSVPPRVLVVDDALYLRTTMVAMLTAQGKYTVCEAGTYLEALELLDSVDAVATDGFFPYGPGDAPGSWGLNLARLARAYRKRVVLISGDQSLVEQALWEGIEALEKPRGILELATLLASAEPPNGEEACSH